MLAVSLLSLFLAGLLGGGHCLGMCGGMITAFSLHLPAKKYFQFLLGLNIGRLISYAMVGSIMGALGSTLYWSQLFAVQLILQSIACFVLLLLGLYIAGLSNKLSQIEKIGQPIWRFIQPFLSYFLPLRFFWQTLPVGFLWGGLPCGLVYTAAISALAAASYWKGLLCMVAFGIGTLPNLLLMGVFAGHIKRYWQKRGIKMASGLLIVTFALLQISKVVQSTGMFTFMNDG
jgi:sulfite exporter TauE/SafE